jgi:hypothetical protein
MTNSNPTHIAAAPEALSSGNQSRPMRRVLIVSTPRSRASIPIRRLLHFFGRMRIFRLWAKRVVVIGIYSIVQQPTCKLRAVCRNTSGIRIDKSTKSRRPPDNRVRIKIYLIGYPRSRRISASRNDIGASDNDRCGSFWKEIRGRS